MAAGSADGGVQASCASILHGGSFILGVREGLGEGVGDGQLDAELLGDFEDRTN